MTYLSCRGMPGISRPSHTGSDLSHIKLGNTGRDLVRPNGAVFCAVISRFGTNRTNPDPVERPDLRLFYLT